MENVTLLKTVFNKENLKEVIEFYNIELIIPGAEKYIYDGVGDWCSEWRIACFGPSARAASLERSKIFSKILMTEAGVPTASYKDLSKSFTHQFEEMASLLKDFKKPVIKISGPSLGKGVFVCADVSQALKTLEEIKKTPLPGLEEGLMVEEGLSGKEVSLFYACHGETFTYLGAAQDHKRLLDNDEGPNTGGMGTVSPVEWVDDKFIQDSNERFLIPTLKRMNERGIPFKGILFLGLMVGPEGSFLLEYNVRFGDPETQVLMPLIQGDLSLFLFELSSGYKLTQTISLKNKSAVHVVKAASGYPGTFGTPIEKDQKITFHHLPQDTLCFYAGVRRENDGLVSSGGRVLGITGLGDSKKTAKDLAYKNLGLVSFNGEHFRTDIGGKA
jgi:phosphoribosylamine--glycine ligase